MSDPAKNLIRRSINVESSLLLLSFRKKSVNCEIFTFFWRFTLFHMRRNIFFYHLRQPVPAYPYSAWFFARPSPCGEPGIPFHTAHRLQKWNQTKLVHPVEMDFGAPRSDRLANTDGWFLLLTGGKYMSFPSGHPSSFTQQPQ